MLPTLLATGASIVAVMLVLRLRRRAAVRKRLLATPLSMEQRAILQARVPLARNLPGDLRDRLERRIQVFLAEKTFLGCRGVVVDESMKITVAGHACLLLLGQAGDETYPDLSTIYLYPSTYVRRDEWALDGGVVVRAEGMAFDGESWDRASVVLSLSAVQEGLEEFDGFNVVLHEFAHQFDALDGDANGCPPMEGALRRRWAPAMKQAWNELAKADRRGRDTFLDPYGAESPAEFFAVLTEAFFELPRELEEAHPDLVPLLREAYGLDPREFHPSAGVVPPRSEW